MSGGGKPLSDAEIQKDLEALKAQGAPPEIVHKYLLSVGAQPIASDATADIKRANATEQGLKAQHREDIPDYGGRNVNTGLMGKVLSGATFGVAPKAMAGIDALRDAVNGASAGQPFGETLSRAYNDNLNARNAASAQTGKETPVGSFVAEAGGSLLNPLNKVAGMIGGAPTTALGRIGASAAQGGALGAAYGAGGAEWRGPDGLANTLKGAGGGAGIGLLTGGALQGGGEAISAIRTLARMRAASPSSPMARILPGDTRSDVAAQKVLGVLDEAGVPVEGLAGRASDAPLMLGELAGNPGQRALRAVQTVGGKGANAVERSLVNRQQGALGRVSGALEDASGTAGKDAVQLADEVRAAQVAAAGPNYEAAYAHGAFKSPDVLAKMDELLNLPEGGNQPFLAAYMAGRKLQAIDPTSVRPWVKANVAADAGVGADAASAQAARADAIGSLGKANKTLNAPTSKVPLDNLAPLGGKAVEQEAAKRAAAEAERQAATNELARISKTFDPSQGGADAAGLLGHLADGKLTKVDGRWTIKDLTVEDLDLMKQGLDVLAQPGATNAIPKRFARAIGKRIDEMRRAADAEVPTYGAARSAFKGDADFQDALEMGRTFVNEDPRIIAKTLKDYSPSEQEAYRVGATDELLRRLRSAPDAADVVKRVFGSPEKRDALRALFPDEAKYRAFTRTMQQEALAARTNQTVRGNSQTANKMADAESLFGDALGATLLPHGVIGASPEGVALRLLARGREASDRVAGQALASDVGNILRTRTNDPEAMKAAIARLAQASAKRQAAGAAARTRGGQIGGTTADAILNP